jgi:hypothetical protein
MALKARNATGEITCRNPDLRLQFSCIAFDLVSKLELSPNQILLT